MFKILCYFVLANNIIKCCVYFDFERDVKLCHCGQDNENSEPIKERKTVAGREMSDRNSENKLLTNVDV